MKIFLILTLCIGLTKSFKTDIGEGYPNNDTAYELGDDSGIYLSQCVANCIGTSGCVYFAKTVCSELFDTATCKFWYYSNHLNGLKYKLIYYTYGICN